MDNNWKDIFDQAEKAPNPDLWKGIEADLNRGSKKGFMIPLAWAATISLALASTILIWYNLDSGNGELELASTETPAEIEKAEGTEDAASTQEAEVLAEPEYEPIASRNDANSVQKAEPTASYQTFQPMADVEDQQLADLNQTEETVTSEHLDDQTVLVADIKEDLTNEETPIEDLKPVIDETLPDEQPINQDSLEQVLRDSYFGPDPEDLAPKKQKSKRRLWAGISQGYGGFNSNFGSANSANESLAFSEDNGGEFTLRDALASEQRSQNQLNEQALFNTALWVGIPMNQSMALMTGFGYSRSNYSSTAASYNGELLHFTAEPIAIGEGESSEYERVNIEGTYDMAFIPIVMDWAILRNQFGLSFQIGPEVGFLLQQRIRSDEVNASRTSGVGELYNPVHLRMTSGLAFTYQIRDNYQLSLQPRAAHAITSVTRQNTAYSSYPLNYSLMLGFRYIF